MSKKDWLTGLSIGALSGMSAQSLKKSPSVYKMKFERKKDNFVETGKEKYRNMQAARQELQRKAKTNTKGKLNMENNQTTQNQTQPKRGGRKLPLAIITGAVIGGAFILIKDPQERQRLKEGSRSTKESVTGFASEVKEDPSGKKDDIMTRVKRVVNITNEAISTIQEVFNNQGKEISDKVQDIKEESEEIISTAKDAGEDLQEAGSKAKEAKEELTDSEDEAAATSNTEDNVVSVNKTR
ncbi:hypothetical protein [Halobacillus halophilus]|uniref:hypothetical protein n=1 Tax=Halobacillus halophilus TaxID=1570 RepID=UPI001CD27A03|nr:hypothetical protein [Halobacillus halophilus]MCA1012255.1 hypothetical protein [Halobacillus halophilus]